MYAIEPKPLKEGEEKHIVSVFVADEAGLINRVAGVFARRGANIESLAVGLTRDKALFTIVLTGTNTFVSNLVKQLSKLVKVRYVEDITKTDRIERELLLLKLRAPAGPDRTEILQISQIFRARIVDVSDDSVSLCVTGDPGKLAALQKVLSRFGILELARTGRVCLKRGAALMETGSNLPETAKRAIGAAPAPQAAAAAAPASSKGRKKSAALASRDADVYVVDSDNDEMGVWDVKDVLDATYAGSSTGPDGQGTDFKPYTLNIEVQDVPGVLNQVTQVFARRGYNVQSLAVGPSEREGRSRICMVVPGKSAQAVSSLMKQLAKLVHVESLTDLTETPFVNRELMLIKVRCPAGQRGELRDLAQIFRGGIVDVSAGTVTLEVLGKEDKMKAITELLEPYGILEIARTGRVALPRESGVNSEYLEKMSIGRVW